MGKNKLKKFADMEAFSCVFQFPFSVMSDESCPMRGKWNSDYFHNDAPIVLELGCGKGEYAVGLGKRFPDKNYIGVDIKGARMWTGAKMVEQEGMKNVAFLRTSIEMIDRMFAPGEISEIWITFPDPQMKKARKRLTSTRFLTLYRHILRPDGVINLKTDSPFLYEYTRRLVELNGFEVIEQTDDLYGTGHADPVASIKTYYEQQWLSRGKKIKLLRFRLPADGELLEPREDDIEKDDYRAIPRPSILPMPEN